MTEPTTPELETAAVPEEAAAPQFTPPASQADLDKIISAAVARTHKKYGMTPAEAQAAKAEIDRVTAANQTEAQRQEAEKARWQTEAETWRGLAVSSRIETLAAEFADPTDASSALAGRNYLDAGGQIDENAIRTDLAEVLDKKPHWRKGADAPSGPRAPSPNPAQGTSGTNAHAAPRDQFAAILQGR